MVGFLPIVSAKYPNEIKPATDPMLNINPTKEDDKGRLVPKLIAKCVAYSGIQVDADHHPMTLVIDIRVKIPTRRRSLASEKIRPIVN